MSALLTATEALVDRLRAAGVRVTMDVRNLNLPTVLVVPPQFLGDSNCGGTASFTLYLITRAPANADAWKSLDGLLDQVTAELDDIRVIRPSSYDPEGTGPLPSLEVVFTQTLDW